MEILQPEAWSLLIASWLNIVLYATEFLLCVYYYIESSKRGTKWYMMFSLFVDTLCTVVVCCNVYYPLVIYKGVSVRPFESWSVPITVTTTFLSAMLEQGYFAYRYWVISRNRIATTIIVFLIFALPAFAIASSVALSILGEKLTGLTNPSIIVSCVLTTATDILLAAVTVWKLKNIKTIYDTTKNLVRRVSTFAIVYGVTTATATMLMMCMYFASIDVYIIVFFCLGRIYSLTVFLNLILLREWRSISSPSHSATGSLQPSPLTQIDFEHLEHGDSTIKQAHEVQSRNSMEEPYTRPMPAPSFSMDSI